MENNNYPKKPSIDDYCVEKNCALNKHFYHHHGKIYAHCAFCGKKNPNYQIEKICPNHFSIFNILKIRCTKNCKD